MKQNKFYVPNVGAEFSECGKYRFVLWRIWDERLPKIMFIGLNPSTADKTENDPTIRRVMKFAADWGYGGVYMLNLFTFVTPYPKELLTCEDPVNGNDAWLLEYSQKAGHVVFAWGSFKECKQRAEHVMNMFPKAVVLNVCKDGSPGHPLYVKGDVTPINFDRITLK